MYIDTSAIASTSKHSLHRSSVRYECKNEKNFFFAEGGSAASNPLTIWFAQRESAWLNSERRCGDMGSPSLIARSSSK
jgi:hypothetical protein